MAEGRRINFLLDEAVDIISNPYDNLEEFGELFARYPLVGTLFLEAIKHGDEKDNEAWFKVFSVVMQHTPITTRALNQFMKGQPDTGDSQEDTRMYDDPTESPNTPTAMNEKNTTAAENVGSAGDKDTAVSETERASGGKSEHPDETKQLDAQEKALEGQDNNTQVIEEMKATFKKYGLRNMSVKKLAKEQGIPVTSIQSERMCEEILDSGKKDEFMDYINAEYGEGTPQPQPKEDMLTEAEARKLEGVDTSDFEVGDIGEIPETPTELIDAEYQEKPSAVNGSKDVESVDSEDVDYSDLLKLKAQDLYKLCLEKKLPVKPMQPREYYIEALKAHNAKQSAPAVNDGYPETAIEVYKLCVAKGLKPEVRRPREYYVELLEGLKSWDI